MGSDSVARKGELEKRGPGEGEGVNQGSGVSAGGQARDCEKKHLIKFQRGRTHLSRLCKKNEKEFRA